MLNLGGPASLDEVQPFLLELFADREIIHLPFQAVLGRLIARMRAPKVRARYAEIGGGSPIGRWTNLQGEGMLARLDQLSPETAPHQCYIAFRYAFPRSEDALRQMRANGVRRAVAFTQYPQYSTTTTGSSLNELWRAQARLGMDGDFQWSVIKRWSEHPGYIRSVAESIRIGLNQFAEDIRKEVLILFSAHSLPVRVVRAGDPYPGEIETTVQAVMQELSFSHEHRLCYQSKVGPVRWLEPQTGTVIRELGRQNCRAVLVVPLGFTSDHIETLHEIDIEYCELAKQAGIKYFHRAPALNDHPLFLDALAGVAAEHLRSERR